MSFQTPKIVAQQLKDWKSSYRFDHHSNSQITCRIIDTLTGAEWCKLTVEAGVSELDALLETIELAKTRNRPISPSEAAIQKAAALEETVASQSAEIARLKASLAAASKQPDPVGKPGKGKGRGQSPVVPDPVDLGSAAGEDDEA